MRMHPQVTSSAQKHLDKVLLGFIPATVLDGAFIKISLNPKVPKKPPNP